MRFLISVTLILTILASGIASADQAAVTDMVKKISGLVAYYDLEGDYNDASGNNLNGKQVGDAAAFGWTDGVNGGRAVTIDYTTYNGSFVDIPAAIGSSFDSATASCFIWVKLSPKEGWQAICERSNLWYLETESKPAEWQNNAIVWRIYHPVEVGGGGAGQMRDNANITMENGKWYQLAWTFDGLTMVGFVNGQKVISKDYPEGLGPVAGTPDPPPAGKGANYNFLLGT